MKYRFRFLFVLVFALSISFSLINAQDAAFNESPMLAERVAADQLPPVEERLPANPRVIDLPWAEPGTYGGDFHDPFVGDAFWSSQMVFWTFWKGLVSLERRLFRLGSEHRGKRRRERGCDRVHLPPARWDQMVRWRAVHF